MAAPHARNSPAGPVARGGEKGSIGSGIMHPVISPEMASGAAQMLVYLVTAMVAWLSFMLAARA